MKKTILMMLLGLFMGSSMSYAQLTKEQINQRREIKKLAKKELSDKATKDARKQAKALAKEGWMPAAGALPLERQLDRSYLMQNEFDDDLFPKYLWGEASSVGSNYDAAKMQALELAKINLAREIQTEVAALVENSVSNSQLSAEEAASVTKSVMAAQSLIQQSIGRTVTVVEMYRTLKNKNKEVSVRIAYNSDMAKSAARKAIQDDLAKEGKELQDKLSNMLGR